MKHIQTSTKLAYMASGVLGGIRNKYLILSVFFIIGMALKLVLTSQASLAVLMLATVFPVLQALGISTITSASVLALLCLDYGPNDGSMIFMSTVAEMNVVELFLQYQWKVALCIILVTAVLISFYYRYMDARDARSSGAVVTEKKAVDAARVQFMESKVPVYRGCEEPIICNEIPERKPELPRVTHNDCHGDFLPLPEAKIVMDSKIPKVILPLDATWRACITEEQIKTLEEIGTPAAKFTAVMVQKRIDNLKVNDVTQHNCDLRHTPGTVGSAVLYRYDNDRAPIHDALTIAYLIDESIVTEYVDANVDVDISGGICDGLMVVDVHNTKKGKEPITAKVALNADGDKFAHMLFENFKKSAIDNI